MRCSGGSGGWHLFAYRELHLTSSHREPVFGGARGRRELTERINSDLD